HVDGRIGQFADRRPAWRAVDLVVRRVDRVHLARQARVAHQVRIQAPALAGGPGRGPHHHDIDRVDEAREIGEGLHAAASGARISMAKSACTTTSPRWLTASRRNTTLTRPGRASGTHSVTVTRAWTVSPMNVGLGKRQFRSIKASTLGSRPR